MPYPNEAYDKSRGEDAKVSDKEDANVKLTNKTLSITESQQASSTPTNFSGSNLDLQHIGIKVIVCGCTHTYTQILFALIHGDNIYLISNR